ncbi:hypothetical protein [Xanthomonas hortorum]|uniref:hypothetical protein n=1 Tax=Xanthomonas hortorum TaxID=56454 RepID=UPI002936AC66|nr:hypothetical protein [Xanthomonas hortorum]MDV2449819.1 hypothetical protein [Xanthomonas hortorum NBC5720]
MAVFKIEAAPAIAPRTPSTNAARLKPVAHHATSLPAPTKPPIKGTATLVAAPANGADWQEFWCKKAGFFSGRPFDSSNQ